MRKSYNLFRYQTRLENSKEEATPLILWPTYIGLLLAIGIIICGAFALTAIRVANNDVCTSPELMTAAINGTLPDLGVCPNLRRARP